MAPFSWHFIIPFFKYFSLGYLWVFFSFWTGLSLLFLFCSAVFCAFAMPFHLYRLTLGDSPRHSTSNKLSSRDTNMYFVRSTQHFLQKCKFVTNIKKPGSSTWNCTCNSLENHQETWQHSLIATITRDVLHWQFLNFNEYRDHLGQVGGIKIIFPRLHLHSLRNMRF